MKQMIVNNILIELEKKKIKNMYLRILPPDGKVRISAPIRMSEEEIRRFAFSKLEWMIKQQEKMQQRHQNKDIRYETGEKIPIWGSWYELIVKEGSSRNKVLLEGSSVILYTRVGSTTEQREKIMATWYKGILQGKIPYLISKWENVIGVKSNSWSIRNMKTRWGTCNIRTRGICLNLQLAKKSPECLEYVVVHELTHLLEASHNDIFKKYLDHFLPQWRMIKKELNKIE